MLIHDFLCEWILLYEVHLKDLGLAELRETYRRQLGVIAALKQQLADLDLGDDEEVRELEVERSLLAGEWNTEDQRLRKVRKTVLFG